VRRFSGPVLFVLFSIAIFALGAVIGQRPYSGSSAEHNSADEPGNASNSHVERKYWWQRDPTADFTLALVIVGLLQVSLFYVQLRIMGSQLGLIRESLDDAKVAADAAKEGADAAKIQAEAAKIQAQTARGTLQTMQDTATRELRAYVLVSGGKIRNVDSPLGRIAELSIRNFGKTPAHDLKMWMGAGVKEFPVTTALGRPGDNITIASDVLAPGIPSVMRVPIHPVNGWWESRLNDRTAAIYLFGEVTYLDAFDKLHRTEFRHMCFGEGLSTGEISPYPEGNRYT
jgi:hypothetical protein